MRVFIAQADDNYINMWKEFGAEVELFTPEGVDLVQFTGGADVSPFLYGEQAHPKTFNNPERDEIEEKLFDLCLQQRIPMAGICRGGQFLNVMNNGRMWQDVDGHTQSHKVIDLETKEIYYCSSTHHQMMDPTNEAIKVAVSYPDMATRREGSNISIYGELYIQDYEVLFYPKTQSLCFQPHPEFPGYDECRNYYFTLIERFFNESRSPKAA